MEVARNNSLKAILARSVGSAGPAIGNRLKPTQQCKTTQSGQRPARKNSRGGGLRAGLDRVTSACIRATEARVAMSDISLDEQWHPIIAALVPTYHSTRMTQPTGSSTKESRILSCHAFQQSGVPLQSTGAQSKGSQEQGQPHQQRQHENTKSTQYRDLQPTYCTQPSNVMNNDYCTSVLIGDLSPRRH